MFLRTRYDKGVLGDKYLGNNSICCRASPSVHEHWEWKDSFWELATRCTAQHAAATSGIGQCLSLNFAPNTRKH
jgi:hypothetical protein